MLDRMTRKMVTTGGITGFVVYGEKILHDFGVRMNFTTTPSKESLKVCSVEQSVYHAQSQLLLGLVESMLQFEPSKRATTEEVLKDPWMRDKVLSKEDLKIELIRKKPGMEEGRRLAALEKQE